MILKKGQYYYTPHGRGFRIYRYDGTIGSPVPGEPTHTSRSTARARVYELNGWNNATKT